MNEFQKKWIIQKLREVSNSRPKLAETPKDKLLNWFKTTFVFVQGGGGETSRFLFKGLAPSRKNRTQISKTLLLYMRMKSG